MGLTPRWFTVRERRLLGGEHPCPGGDAAEHRVRLDALLSLGVTTFVDLTQHGRENGVQPYARLLRARTRESLSIAYHNVQIPDVGVPRSPEQVEHLLDLIDAALCNDERVYLHCRAGVGRTGMVLALHLVRHGASGADALKKVQAAWQRDSRSQCFTRAPQTDAQCEYVRRHAG